jgi:hypothetical protein
VPLAQLVDVLLKVPPQEVGALAPEQVEAGTLVAQGWGELAGVPEHLETGARLAHVGKDVAGIPPQAGAAVGICLAQPSGCACCCWPPPPASCEIKLRTIVKSC